MRKFLILLVMASIALPIASASAADASWTDKIKVGLEARVRNESQFDYDLNAKAEDKDNFSLLRARLNVTATPTENFRGFIQIQSSRVFGDSALSGTFGPGNTARGIAADDEDIALHQGYLDIIGNDLTFRVGRQEMIFGDQRLVGALGWSNRGRSFDGVSLIHDTDSHKATLFFHLIQRNAAGTTTLALSPLPPTPPALVTVTFGAPGNNDPMFFGANVTLKEIGNGLDVYLFGFVDRDGQTINPAKVQDGNLAFATLGFRTKDMPGDGIGYDLEGAVQGGENDDVGIMAFAGHVALGFGVEDASGLKLLAEYNIASGDNPN
ncbi:MAG: alginate export family protein, partial [Chrysiogenetes bacterium]|nr:alginate export family protein [Chrysiogenetes bacterium]